MENKYSTFKVYESLDSTNSEGKRLALKATPATWILGLRQTDGRARGKKRWHSMSRNFTSSLLFYPDMEESKLPFFSFVAGVAMFDTLVQIGVNSDNLCLKWPNDLLLNKKKIGGILLESVGRAWTKQKALIVGFGLNLVSCPNQNDLESDALSPGYLGSVLETVPNAEEFLKMLMPVFDKWSSTLLNREFSQISDAFLQRTIPVGTQIKVKTLNNTTIGSFFGLSEDGSLILDCLSGRMLVSAGDVALVGK